MLDSTSSALLPTASGKQVVAAMRRLVDEQRWPAFWLLLLQGGATLAGLVGPWALGVVVEAAAQHRLGKVVGPVVLLFVVATLVRTGLSWWAGRRGGVLGSHVLTRLREEFLGNVLRLPLSVVERAGTGDLLTRATSDVDGLGQTVQRALPEIAIATVTVLLTIAALIWTAPLLALTLVPAAVILAVATRWYLHRAPAAYLRERAAQGRVNGLIQESVEAGRTIEAMRLGRQRVEGVDSAVADWLLAERATLRLRTVFFPISEATYLVPLVLSVGIGGVLHSAGLLGLGALTAAALYTQQLIEPVDVILSWLDQLQLGGASLARLIGVGQVERQPDTDAVPQGQQLDASSVHFAYRPRHDVLHGLSLRPKPGTRVAVVGPSGSGKSTLALLLAGVFGPRQGRVTVGGVDVHRMASDRLRAQVVLLTQEHHVFSGTLQDNLRLAAPGATDQELVDALEAVGASDWLAELDSGLATPIGSGGVRLSPGQAQQLALARLLLADPHTLVLDEATSLLNPRAARRLERSLATVLKGRTVVTVSHRLQSAVDADLVVVVSEGRAAESGSHRELLRAGGGYAALWSAYQGTEPAAPVEGGSEPS
ncbi:MAG TPA: ABC transporter ATP-binding protein [Candidatus Dormibacteraeota bacterium]|nr:ABC transporter ATP-binding protein [Candidatus Dormibacteraeota bacterium]